MLSTWLVSTTLISRHHAERTQRLHGQVHLKACVTKKDLVLEEADSAYDGVAYIAHAAIDAQKSVIKNRPPSESICQSFS